MRFLTFAFIIRIQDFLKLYYATITVFLFLSPLLLVHNNLSIRITYESKIIYPDSFLRTLSESQKVAFDEAQKRSYYAQLSQIMEMNLYI